MASSSGNLTMLHGGGVDIVEPDWSAIIAPRLDKAHLSRRKTAREHWTRVTRALREAGTLAPENAPQVFRLVIAYLRFDAALAHVLIDDPVVGSSKTGVPQLSMWQVEMRQADADATTLEMELCLNPRRRGSATKTQKKARSSAAAETYLAKPGAG